MRNPGIRVGVIIGLRIIRWLLGFPMLSPTELDLLIGAAVMVWGVLVLQQELVAIRRKLVDTNGYVFMLYRKNGRSKPNPTRTAPARFFLQYRRASGGGFSSSHGGANFR